MPFFIDFWMSSWSCDVNSCIWSFLRLHSCPSLLPTCSFSRVCSLLSKGHFHPPSCSTVNLKAHFVLFLTVFPVRWIPSLLLMMKQLLYSHIAMPLYHLLELAQKTHLAGFMPPSLHPFTFHSRSMLFKRLSLSFANSPSMVAPCTHWGILAPRTWHVLLSLPGIPSLPHNPVPPRIFSRQSAFHSLGLRLIATHPLGALIHSSRVGWFPLLCVPIEPCTFSVIIFVLLCVHVCRVDLCILSAETAPGP